MIYDVAISDEGTIWLFTAISDKALDFFKKQVASETWQWMGDRTIAVDHRFAFRLLTHLSNNGMTLRKESV